MLRYQHISVAIPMMAEWENVPSLVERFRQQTIREFTLYLCVNQPEDDLEAFKDNQLTLNYLNQVTDLDIRVIDRSSPGLGWSGKQKGVGWARKLLFAKILEGMEITPLSIFSSTILVLMASSIPLFAVRKPVGTTIAALPSSLREYITC